MPRTLQAFALVSPDLISCQYVSTSSARCCCFFDSTPAVRSAYCREDRRASSCAATAAWRSPSLLTPVRRRPLRRCTLPFSPGRDLVGQPEQTLRTSEGHPGGAEFAESPLQPPISARPANPSGRG